MFTSHTPQYRVPTELLDLIVHAVEDSEDLHSLAQTSRDLNFLAVDELCSRYNVQPWLGTLILDASTFPVLPTLAVSLCMTGKSLQYLNCDLTTDVQSQTQMMKQTTSLINFIGRLAFVEKASFYFLKNGTKEWESAMATVLDILVARSCSDLHIKTLARSEMPSVQNKSLSTFLHKLSLLNGVKKKNAKPVLAQSQPNHLRNCYIQTFPIFLQPFFLCRLNSASQLTTLTFRYIYNHEEWDEFLTNIRLPNLSDLTISHCIIPDKTISSFFHHHPTITSLDFHHNTYPHSNPLPLHSNCLPNLTKLRTSSEYLVRYFPSLNSFPKLNQVTLPAGDMTRDASRAVLALHAIVPCVNEITLSLEFSYVACLDHWLRNNLRHAHTLLHSGEREAEPTRLLYCVKSLKLDSKLIAHSSDGIVELLVQWLSMFPALRKVFIARTCLPRQFGRPEFEDFAKKLERSSPSLRSISVQTDDYRIWSWEFD